MLPACVACKKFCQQAKQGDRERAWESGFGVRTCAWRAWLVSVRSGTKMQHLNNENQLCQPDVCQVAQLVGAVHLPTLQLQHQVVRCSWQDVLLSQVSMDSALPQLPH